MADDPTNQPPPRNGGSRPVPDPTLLTDQAIDKAVEAMTDKFNGQLAVRDERLRGIDEATKLRLESVVGFSDQITSAIGRLEDVMEEKFRSIQKQFDERDTRQERESRDNKVAVDAAFAAQKEAAAKQDEANAKAIDKSEKATAETITANQQLNRTETAGLTKGLDELRQAVTRIESRGIGASETRVEGRLSSGAMVAAASVIVAVITVGVTIAIFMSSR